MIPRQSKWPAECSWVPMRCVLLSLSLVVAACSLGLSLAACSGGNGGSSDAGTGCPPSPPAEGSSCPFEEGLTCNYGGSAGVCGGGDTVTCSNGSWQYAATPGAGAIQACPVTIPTPGSPCSLSGCGAEPSCSYGCDQGGPAYATCNGSTWNVSYSGVACYVDGGDAGDAADSGDAGDAADGSVSCHTSNDCSSFDYCLAPGGPYEIGYPPGPHCSSDAQCIADAGSGTCGGSACVCQGAEWCLAQCQSDSECGSGFGFIFGDGTGIVCGIGGHCVPKSCNAPADCPAQFDCAANQCIRRSCTADTDCAAPGACVNGACYPGVGTCHARAA